MPVDCYELETLRKFRDNWVSKHENGPAEIKIYYDIAPKIVEKLNHLPNSKEIYEKIYQEVVIKCVQFIEEGMRKMHIHYIKMHLSILRNIQIHCDQKNAS